MMKVLKTVLFVLVMIPTSIVISFSLILLFFMMLAVCVKAVEIWLGAEVLFQALAVLFLFAAMHAPAAALNIYIADRDTMKED